MAIITRSGALGLATFSFDFDDVAVKLIAVRASNNEPVKNLLITLPKGTFTITPGNSVSQTLNPPQQEAYSLTTFHGNPVFNFAWSAELD